MDFRRRKLELALPILLGGMLLAVLWHGTAALLRRGYPWNTFLFVPSASYTDFTDFLKPTVPAGNYFPSAYPVFYIFSSLPPLDAALLFQIIFIIGLFFLLRIALRPLDLPRHLRYLAYVTLLGSYPVLFCLDRGNIEILLSFCIGASLLLYAREKFGLSLLALLPAICFKFYPCLLLLLFFRRRLILLAVIGGGAFFLVNWAALQVFHPIHPVRESYVPGFGFAYFLVHYILGPAGVSTSADAWNLFRLGVLLVHGCLHQSFSWPMPAPTVIRSLAAYCVVAIWGLALAVLYVLRMEKSLERRAIMLLLYMTISIPCGGDYKLLHVLMSLVLIILITERRPGDIGITALLALALIPKREILLGFLGNGSSGAPDASIAIILNPLCILTAMGLLFWNARRVRQPTITEPAP